MRKEYLTITVFLSLTLLFSGCGRRRRRRRRRRREGVRILHASVDSAPFQLASSTSTGEVLQIAKFSLPERYFGIPGGDQILNAACAKGAPVFSFLDSR